MSIFKDWQPKHSVETGDTLYADIINHCQNYQQYMQQGDKFTTAHEETHGCNSDIRMDAGAGMNGFYVGKNRAIALPEPNCKKSDCIKFIPVSMKGYRYDLYVTGQQEWNDAPLYLFDEFTAYINGALSAIELKRKENYVENVVIDGPIEFITYIVATLMAVEQANELKPPLIGFGLWMLRHAYNSYFESLKDFPPFAEQDKIYQLQKSSPDWQPQRDFLSKLGYVLPDGIVPEDDDPPTSEVNWLI